MMVMKLKRIGWTYERYTGLVFDNAAFTRLIAVPDGPQYAVSPLYDSESAEGLHVLRDSVNGINHRRINIWFIKLQHPT